MIEKAILTEIHLTMNLWTPRRFGTVLAHLDLDGEVSGSSSGHTNNLKKLRTAPQPGGGHNELE